ncbi:MAG: fibronectin type III domain-containing protein [Candidatus Levybacteria bacterium]|nr:fibronectin type III domain-containing protein [Candidatus Levybacteria bacterium]
MGRFFLVFILLISYFFLIPHTLGEVEANHCTAQRPGSAPILTAAVPSDRSVSLTWVEAQDPITYYLVAYGTSPNGIEYGAPNIGGRGTTSFTVSELTNGVKYYFRVRAVNGCKPGKFSNKLSAVPGTQLGTVPGTQKTLSKGPNLSIYKPILGASLSAAPTQEKKISKAVASINKSPSCQKCISWQLLVAEAILLIFYLVLASKTPFLKQIFLIFIPIIIYVLFRQINGTCSNDGFWCKYFLQLNILIFIFAVIFSKRQKILKK